nr:glycosyl hydrolase family 17 [Colletotrichum truncatum]KAF6788875.1 glycosyl hydrolase family 17 [Colletotrichum truncatum]
MFLNCRLVSSLVVTVVNKPLRLGWPSEGAKYQHALPGFENAEAFYSEGVYGMIRWGFNVFFFEAFDEPWKPHAIGEDGSEAPEGHWGGMKADRSAKYPLRC